MQNIAMKYGTQYLFSHSLNRSKHFFGMDGFTDIAATMS
jgi:hypothetical protein